MAADTAIKRYSAMHISLPWRGLNVVPNAAIPQGERQAVMFMYSGVLAGGAPPPAPEPEIIPTPEPFTGGGGGGAGGPLDMGEESPPLKPIIDIREPADRFRAQRERQGRIREQLRVALEGPQAAEVRAYVEPTPSDSARPLQDRIEVARLSDEQIERIGAYYRGALEYQAAQQRRAAEEARQRDIDEDDDEVLTLL